MFWKKSCSTRRTPWCQSLNEDILRLVFEEVDTYRGLSNLCQVSRQFYQLAIVRLYRGVELNISTPSHQRLLRRLACPKDRFAMYIRILIINGIEHGQSQAVFYLSLTLSRFVNLEALAHKGSVVFPKCILDTLCNRTGAIDSGHFASALMPGMPQPLYTSLTGLACVKLTSLYINLEAADPIQETLKSDLVQMLLHARCLKVLQMFMDTETDQEFPDLSPNFDYDGLPKLEELWLIIGEMEVFTPNELWHWGAVGGWQDLKQLTFERPRDLLAFVGNAPRLKSICFAPQGQWDIDDLASHLSEVNCDAPFGEEIEEIRLQGLTRPSYLPMGLSNTIPWSLLKHAQNITALIACRPRFNGSLPGSSLVTTTAQDVLQLRSLCPRLEELWVDLVYGPNSPADINDVIIELAQIKKLSKLIIYINIESSRFHPTILTRWGCRLIFNTIVRQRMSKQLPCKAPFAVSFKLVREWDKMEGHFDMPDYEFWIDKTGVTNFRRRSEVASWEDLKGNARWDYYKARDSLYRAFRGEVAK
jgi:hypothetical protein